MSTADRMKQRRKELGLSAESVAEKLGCSPATIYRYENGDIEKMPIDILRPLSAILKTTVFDLMELSVTWEDDLYSDFWDADDLSRIQILKNNGIPDSLISEANRLGLNAKPSASEHEGLENLTPLQLKALECIKNMNEDALKGFISAAEAFNK